MAPSSMFHGHHFIEVRSTIVYEIPYISRLSYQHCIHDRLSATIFGTHIWIDMGLSRTQFFLTHPTPRGGARGAFRGSKIQKYGKCHELPRKSIIKTKKPPDSRGPGGDFKGLAIQKVREMSWTAEKINNLFNPHRTLWLGALGLKITREGQFFGDTGTEGGRDEEGWTALNISTGPLALHTFQTAGPVRASTLYLSLALQDHQVKCWASRLKITVARSITNFATFSCVLFLKFRYVCIA